MDMLLIITVLLLLLLFGSGGYWARSRCSGHSSAIPVIGFLQNPEDFR